MKTTKFNLLGILSCALSIPASAQLSDLQERHFQSDDEGTPPSRLYYDYMSPMDFNDVAGDFSFNSLNLHTPFAGKSGDTFSWDLELDFGYAQFDPTGQLSLIDHDLYRFGVDFNAMYTPAGSDWSPFMKLSPHFGTDFDDLSWSDFRMTAALGTFYEVHSNLKFAIGAAYLQDVRDNPFFPVVGVTWTPNPCWELVILGNRGDLIYKPHEDWRIRLYARTDSRNWAVQQGGESRDLELTSYRAGLGVDYQVHEHFWLQLSTGMTFGNELILYKGDSDTKIFDEEAESGWFGTFGLRLKF